MNPWTPKGKYTLWICYIKRYDDDDGDDDDDDDDNNNNNNNNNKFWA